MARDSRINEENLESYWTKRTDLFFSDVLRLLQTPIADFSSRKSNFVGSVYIDARRLLLSPKYLGVFSDVTFRRTVRPYLNLLASIVCIIHDSAMLKAGDVAAPEFQAAIAAARALLDPEAPDTSLAERTDNFTRCAGKCVSRFCKTWRGNLSPSLNSLADSLSEIAKERTPSLIFAVLLDGEQRPDRFGDISFHCDGEEAASLVRGLSVTTKTGETLFIPAWNDVTWTWGDYFDNDDTS